MMLYQEAEAQKMQDDRSYGIRGGINKSSPVVERDPECIENLVAQVVSQINDNKHALRSLRADYLGPWPEAADVTSAGVPYSTEGLVGQLRMALYSVMDDSREIRDHIVAISKGVR